MASEVWLHIGTPKSGTSSLQKYFEAHKAALSSQGLVYVAPEGRGSCNPLAIAYNKQHPDLVGLAADIDGQIAAAGDNSVLLSSEMFYGQPPEIFSELLPSISGKPLNVLVYLRRQDRYIEAMYLQKSKNGRFFGSMADYLAKFDGSGSDFAAMLRLWQNTPGATLVPRVLERDKLTGGDVVADVLHLLGTEPPEPPEADAINVSPGLHRVQLLQAAARVGIAPPRKLQRNLAARFPQAADDRSPIMTPAERRAFLDKFADGNEAIRARYFPWELSLFDDRGLSDAAPGVTPFTPDQLDEIVKFLAALKAVR